MSTDIPKFEPPRRRWPAKFRAAGRAMAAALRSQSSFHVHAVATLLVLAAAALLQMGRLQWCLLLLCITSVLAAEMFNTALEILAKAVDREFNAYLAEEGLTDLPTARVQRDGRIEYVLLLGVYESFGQAKQAMENDMPEALRHEQAWIRRLGSVQADMRRAAAEEPSPEVAAIN